MSATADIRAAIAADVFDTQVAALEMPRFDFVLTLVARQTRTKALRERNNAGKYQLRATATGWVFGIVDGSKFLPMTPPSDASKAFDVVRRDLSHLTQGADGYRCDVWSAKAKLAPHKA